jgi:hypothetical protein
MTASARAPAVEILPASKGFRRAPATIEILRCAAAAKQARVRRLCGRPRKAPPRKGPRRPCSEVGGLNMRSRRAIGPRRTTVGCAQSAAVARSGPPVEAGPIARTAVLLRLTCWWLNVVVCLQRRPGVADSVCLVTSAGAFSWPVPRISVRRPGYESLSGCRAVSTAWPPIAARRPLRTVRHGNRSPFPKGVLAAVREAPIGHGGAV